jgi:Tfp pilus assembly protein PilF
MIKALFLALVVAALALPVYAGKKNIDWDQKLKPAYNWLERGDPEKAIEILNDIVRKYPAAGPPHLALGLVYKKKCKFGEAKAEFQKGIQVDPALAEAYYELASIQQNDKEYPQAADNFEKYLQLAPGSTKKASVVERIKACREQIVE